MASGTELYGSWMGFGNNFKFSSGIIITGYFMLAWQFGTQAVQTTEYCVVEEEEKDLVIVHESISPT